MNEKHMKQIVEQFSRTADPAQGQVKVTQLPDYKTVFVETINGVGRSIVLAEYKFDGQTYWAGYSMNSATVFISQANRDV